MKGNLLPLSRKIRVRSRPLKKQTRKRGLQLGPPLKQRYQTKKNRGKGKKKVTFDHKSNIINRPPIDRVLTPHPTLEQSSTSKWNILNTILLNCESPEEKKKKITEAMTKSNGKIIYGYFWMEGCGYCIPLHPIWRDVVTEMEATQPGYFDVEFRKEHTEEARSFLKEKYNLGDDIVVDGYPTIFLIKNNKIEYYNDERTKDRIVQWLTKPER